MKVVVPKESVAGEKRVALVPEGVKETITRGAEVAVQSGAGTDSYYSDEAYRTDGATIEGEAAKLYSQADMVLKVLPPTTSEIGSFKPGTVVVSMLSPMSNPEIVETLRSKEITSFALDLMPRISRAQSMDVLSSMSTIAGYRAALLCAGTLPKFFPMLMTAAGTLPPARAFIIGAGVAGLQAIATCKRLGAIVEAFDVRPAVKEQIESLGGKFVGLALLTEEAEDAGGYAKEVSGDTHAKELDLIASRLPNVDCVVTTALIPGKPAPVLITDKMIETMRPGSVIVDLAAANGGNCEGTVPGETVVRHGVTVIGRTDLLATMATDASRMYSKNISAFIALILVEGKLQLDLEDEIIKGTRVTHEGKIAHEVTRLALERGGSA